MAFSKTLAEMEQNVPDSDARKKLNALFDEDSFNELDKFLSADGAVGSVVSGYGTVNGATVYAYAQDVSVKGGAVDKSAALKIKKLYELAAKNGAPVVAVFDSKGGDINEGMEVLADYGDIIKASAAISGVVPQISAIFGTCGGGMAVASAMADFIFMEEKNAKLFVNSPNALEGNEVSKCNTASAKFQSEDAGLVDFTGSEDEVLSGIRKLVTLLPANNEEDAVDDCSDDLNRVCADLANAAGDTAILLSNIADDQDFVETKADYAKEMVTGFLKLNGTTVGAVANRTEVYGADGEKAEEFEAVLTARGARKAARFVKFCDAFNIPVLTLTNVTGFKADKHSERCIATAVAEMTHAFADATVPKVNVIIGKAYGSAYVAMNSKAVGADMTYAWEDASIGMMDAKLAAKIMYADADAATINEKAAEYASLQESVQSAAARGYVDTIISAEDTRKYVIGAFEMLFTKREDRPAKKHGTV